MAVFQGVSIDFILPQKRNSLFFSNISGTKSKHIVSNMPRVESLWSVQATLRFWANGPSFDPVAIVWVPPLCGQYSNSQVYWLRMERTSTYTVYSIYRALRKKKKKTVNGSMGNICQPEIPNHIDFVVS